MMSTRPSPVTSAAIRSSVAMPPASTRCFLPLRARGIDCVVDLDSMDLGCIAMAKDDLVRAVSIDIGRPEGMAATDCAPLLVAWSADKGANWSEPERIHVGDRLIAGIYPRALRTQGNVLAVLRCRPDGSVIFSPDGNGAFWSDEHVYYRPGDGAEHAGHGPDRPPHDPGGGRGSQRWLARRRGAHHSTLPGCQGLRVKSRCGVTHYGWMALFPYGQIGRAAIC